MASDPRLRFGAKDLPWYARPDWETHPAYRGAPPPYADLSRQYHEDGYVVLKGVVPRELTRAVCIELEPVFVGPRRYYPGRLTDACWGAPAVRRLACFPEILDTLQFLYDRRPIPFQTLNFRHGTEQRSHSDVMFFGSLPPSYMCGVWVALEDVAGDQGPLLYHPGSQRLPDVSPAELGEDPRSLSYGRYEDFMEERMRAEGFEPVRFEADEGDVLIWSSNLVHGGSKIDRLGSTRRSQVTHYFFENCVYYNPLRSALDKGELYLRYPLVDITTGRTVRHSIDGEEVSFAHLVNGRTTLAFPSMSPAPSPWRRAVSAAIATVKHVDARAKLVLPWLLRRPLRR